jgi:hypothetical protein
MMRIPAGRCPTRAAAAAGRAFEESSGSPPEGSRAAIQAPVMPPSLSPLVRPGKAPTSYSHG